MPSAPRAPTGPTSCSRQPRVNEVKEQTTYCDSAEAHNLDFVAQASNGMKFLIDKTLVGDAATRFLADNGALVNMFAGVLTEVGDVYKVMRSALHMFYDVEGRTIAFNRGGSMFFNLRFFIQLHAEGQGAQAGGLQEGKGRWSIGGLSWRMSWRITSRGRIALSTAITRESSPSLSPLPT